MVIDFVSQFVLPVNRSSFDHHSIPRIPKSLDVSCDSYDDRKMKRKKSCTAYKRTNATESEKHPNRMVSL